MDEARPAPLDVLDAAEQQQVDRFGEPSLGGHPVGVLQERPRLRRLGPPFGRGGGRAGLALRRPAQADDLPADEIEDHPGARGQAQPE